MKRLIICLLAVLTLIGIGSATDLVWNETNTSAFPVRYEHASCVFDSKVWISGGYNGTSYLNDVWYSSDGITWTCANASPAFTARAGHGMEALGSKMFVIGGYNGTAAPNDTYASKWDVWESTDGITWTLTTDTPAWKGTYAYSGDPYGLSYFGSMTGDGYVWLTGGYQYLDHFGSRICGNDVWASDDGVTWTDSGNCPQYIFPPSSGSTGWEKQENEWMSIAFVGGKGIYTGSGTTSRYPSAGTAYSSYAGTEWTTRTTTGYWEPRSDFGLVYLDSKLILMGGYGSDSLYHRDVWYSSDEGTTWSEYSDANWSIRKGLTAEVMGTTIYVTGGFGPDGALGDVWAGTLDTATTAPGEEEEDSGAGIQYPPHSVKMRVVTAWGGPVDNATITAQPVETSMGAWGWIGSLFGISDEVNLAGTTMNGTTGIDGSVSFIMLETVQYNVSVTSDEGTASMLIYPKDTEYIIPVTTIDWFTGGEDVHGIITVNATKTTINATHASITVTGNATDAGITSGLVYLNQTNSSVINTEDTLDSYVVTGNFTHTFTVTDYDGENYFVRTNLTHSTYGAYDQDYGISFPLTPVNPLGLTNTELMWVSVLIILVSMTLFTASTAYAGPLLTCFVGWILYALGMLAALGDAYAITVLTAATVLSGFIVIAARRDTK